MTRHESRARQAVDLIDHDDVDLARADILKQHLQGRAVQGSAREPSIVKMGLDQLPALVGLAFDVGLSRFPLGMQRVEVLFKALLR